MTVEKAHAFGLGFPVDPKRLNLGPVVQSQSCCQAEFSDEGAYTFRALHGECGTKLTVRLSELLCLMPESFTRLVKIR